LQHGTLEKVMHFVTWEDSSLKENYVELIKNDILLHDIFNAFSVKNIDLYNYTISFLSKNNIFLSLRELQKQLDENKSISLKTTMDYIDFSIQAKIIRKMYKFDLKTNKYISSRAKYFFSDL
jgi:predicted AAA+ superfamily ATPase